VIQNRGSSRGKKISLIALEFHFSIILYRFLPFEESMCALETPLRIRDGASPLKFRIFGIGGAGCNMVGDTKLHSTAIGSNANDLERCLMAEKMVMSATELSNFAETDPSVLNESIIPSKLREYLAHVDIPVLVSGLGGKTGSSGIRFLATASRILGKMPMSLVSMPFSVESEGRREVARSALMDLISRCDFVLSFENDKLRELVPNMPIDRAFRILNAIMERPVMDLSRVMCESDLPVLKQVAQRSAIFKLGVGLGRGRYRDSMALKETFQSPWYEFHIESSPSAIAILSSYPLEMREMEDITNEIHDRLPDSRLLTGVYEDPSLEDRLRITLMLGRTSLFSE